jgi:hypothetical protein
MRADMNLYFIRKCVMATDKEQRSRRMFFWVQGKRENQITKNVKGGVLLSMKKQVQALILTLKRMSSCSFGSCFNKVHRASMTVEACLVLPLFLFAFLNLISIVEIYRLQGALSAAMHDTIKQMAVYGYEYQKIGGGGAGMAESLGLTYIVAAGKVRTKLGTAYLDNSPLAGGASSISWLRSSVMQKEDCIDLVAEYQIRPPSAVAGWKQRTMYNRMRTRAWTGYDNAGSGGSQSSGEEIVYITPEGSVYHRSRACHYLKLSIAAVDKSFLETQRNQDGEKYYPCGACGVSGGSVVYITGYGNRYHTTLGCSSLKRTIMAVPISETGGRGACSKCG